MSRGSDPGKDRFDRKREADKMHKSQLPGADDEPLPPPVETIHSDAKPKRNEPCPCGSGKKFKQCCGKPSS